MVKPALVAQVKSELTYAIMHLFCLLGSCLLQHFSMTCLELENSCVASLAHSLLLFVSMLFS
jgi:hypothetical protein